MKAKKIKLWRLIEIVVILLVLLEIGVFIFLIADRSNILNRMCSIPPVVYQPSISSVQAYLNKGETLNAYNEVLNYTKEHPNYSVGYKYLGIVLFENGGYNQSTENFQRALQDKNLNNTSKAEITYFIGRNYHLLKDPDTAASYFQKAIEISPSYGPPYDGLGLIALSNKDYSRARSFFEKELSLETDPENNPYLTLTYYYLGQLNFETYNYPKAQEMIETAEKLAKKLPGPQQITILDKIETLRMKIKETLTK